VLDELVEANIVDPTAGGRLAARSAEYASDLISLGHCLQALANVERTLGHGHWTRTGRARLRVFQ
jgi:hypothetical protein